MCNQPNGYSIIFGSSLGSAGKNTLLATREEWPEGEDVLPSIECRFGGKDLWVVQLNSVDDLEDATFCLDLRDYICENPSKISADQTAHEGLLTHWIVMRTRDERR